MQSKKFLSLFFVFSLFTAVPTGMHAGFKTELARVASVPVSVAGHTLFWPAMSCMILMPVRALFGYDVDAAQESIWRQSFVGAIVGAVGIAGGRALREYAHSADGGE